MYGIPVSSLAFVGSIGAILALYVAYWLSLPGVSFYQTIYYLCILFPVAIFAGGARNLTIHLISSSFYRIVSYVIDSDPHR